MSYIGTGDIVLFALQSDIEKKCIPVPGTIVKRIIVSEVNFGSIMIIVFFNIFCHRF